MNSPMIVSERRIKGKLSDFGLHAASADYPAFASSVRWRLGLISCRVHGGGTAPPDLVCPQNCSNLARG